LATLKLRDRDGITTKEGLIFRVFGYSHPPESFVCDVEYASSEIFKSNNPKAPRGSGRNAFYKFYEDEGWKFIQRRFLQYMTFHEMLGKKMVGVNRNDIFEVRKPDVVLRKLVGATGNDDLLAAMRNLLNIVLESSDLHLEDFGVFGSLLHGFHHPKYSDIDLIIYGERNLVKLRETLGELYESGFSRLTNEFETDQTIRGKDWRFKNLSPDEYLWHQRRKLIYALFEDSKTGRTVKTEFEPVKDWKEIDNEYDSKTRIVPRGWTRMLAKVTEDNDAPFVPSTYNIEPLEILEGQREASEAKRVFSYVEEFRMQAKKGETVDVRGNLEEVITPSGNFLQVTLTYCPRYYEQVLKVKV
jgi:predicted nucleotidyltransferase